MPQANRIGAILSAVVLATGFMLAWSAAGQGGADVGVSFFRFVPDEVTIQAGEEVRWTGLAPIHNVVEVAQADWIDRNRARLDGGFLSGEVGDTDSFTVTFEEPGTYWYICEPHIGILMRGIVTVTDGAEDEGEGETMGCSAAVHGRAPGHFQGDFLIVLLSTLPLAFFRLSRSRS